MDVEDIGGRRCLVVAPGELVLEKPAQVVGLFGDAMAEDAGTIVVPAEALDASFYDLRSGFAGEVLQKAANYHIRFAVVGDISRHVAASKAFHDLVVESGRGNGYCFVPDLEALERRLTSAPES